MSRRHTRRTRTEVTHDDHAEQYWGTLPEPEPIPDDWQDAWAETTLDVVQKTWAAQSRRLYSIHRDALLRDDLHDWLLVTAQEIANGFDPRPPDTHVTHDPERVWASYLSKALNARARWHFQRVVARYEEAVEAYRRGIGSVEGLIEVAGDQIIAPRHALHAVDPLNRDPEAVAITMEELEVRVEEAERFVLHQPAGGAYESTTPVCLIAGCSKPRYGRFTMCKSHHDAEQWLWKKPADEQCHIPECDRPLKSRGLCATHQKQLYTGILKPEHHQYVLPPSRGEKKTCLVPECDRTAQSRGLCKKHVNAWRLGRLDIEVPPAQKGRWA